MMSTTIINLKTPSNADVSPVWGTKTSTGCVIYANKGNKVSHIVIGY